MSLLLWLVVGVIAALIVNMLKGHNTVLNSFAALIGSVGSGLIYILATVGNGNIVEAITQINWASFWVSVVGAIALTAISQLFTLEMKEYGKYSENLGS